MECHSKVHMCLTADEYCTIIHLKLILLSAPFQCCIMEDFIFLLGNNTEKKDQESKKNFKMMRNVPAVQYLLK